VRAYELLTAAALVAIAAVAMFDSRATALIDTSGRFPGGIGPGFYPFWAAAVMGAGGLVVLYRAASSRQLAAARIFEDRDAVVAVVKLIGPMLLAAAALAWLGFYVVSGLYMGFFARSIGRYRWLWVALIALAFPTAVYLAFELGFRVRLPKSGLYELGFLI
jgi:Tripartite tricarboxylate transporter TctB family